MATGMVLRVERSSIFDGEGLRTVVFLKGCPLSCRWCSTPESQNPGVERAGDTIYGRMMTVDQVLAEVEKDEVFYFHSGGGLTISGGEPLTQADFCVALLSAACRLGLDTAMETSLCLPWPQVEKVLPYLNTVFADIKLMDPARHQYYCGQDNAMILDNIRRLSGSHWPLRLLIRAPLIPGVNDAEEDLRALGRFCASLPRLDGLQLLPYHRLGVGTYAKLGREYSLPDIAPPDGQHMEACRAILREYLEPIL